MGVLSLGVNVCSEEGALFTGPKASADREGVVPALVGRHRFEKPLLLAGVKRSPSILGGVGRGAIQSQVTGQILRHQTPIHGFLKTHAKKVQHVSHGLRREALSSALRRLAL